VFLSIFGIMFYGGWILSQYLIQNGIISNDFIFLILVGSVIFAFLLSFNILLKVSDYLYLRGY
jgi:hypothetical protein